MGVPPARDQGACAQAKARVREAHLLTCACSQVYVLQNPASTAAPGAYGQRLLMQLEKLRQWDVKYHYNFKKYGAATGAYASPPAL